jgi:hypothetical protein
MFCTFPPTTVLQAGFRGGDALTQEPVAQSVGSVRVQGRCSGATDEKFEPRRGYRQGAPMGANHTGSVNKAAREWLLANLRLA